MSDIEITQQQFLGASIRRFDINLGWGPSPSVLQVGLVEDDLLQEHFDPVLPGSLVRFQYDNWVFDGIVDNYNISADPSGNTLIDVTIVDPRTILEGSQLILDGYNEGVYNVPNLYNVFGYLENIEFGYAEVNDFGIPARKVIDALRVLASNTPLYFNFTPYYFVADFSFVDPDFRISGDHMSVMDFVDIICENYNREYFFEAVGNTVFLTTIDRSFPAQLGRIGDFLKQSSNFSQFTQGIELQKVTTSKFLVGGQVEEMHYQFAGYNANNTPRQKMTVKDFYNNRYRSLYEDDIIWPYWGQDANDNAILGQGLGDDHWFVLDGRSIFFDGIDFSLGYPCDVTELRLASMNINAWRYYLEIRNAPPDTIETVQKGKYGRLGFTSLQREGLLKLIEADPDKMNKMLAKDFKSIATKALIKVDEDNEEIVSKVYEYVKGYANDYYGRKFMVRIPNLQATFDELTQSVKTSLEVTDSGYLNELVENQAIANGWMPYFRDFVKNEDGKIEAYVRFTDLRQVDITSLSEEDFLVEGNYIYVKCTIDQEIVFLNKATAYSPRVVITLPAPVYSKTNGLTTNLLDNEAEKLSINGIFDKTIIGNNTEYKYMAGLPAMPDLAVIPLRNNYKTYGPWYRTYGSTGTCEFEKNEDLVPWNFGSFEALNNAALTLVNSIGINLPYGETGTITFPGAPNMDLGTALIVGGPYISSISTQFDATDGVTTTYTMSKWSSKLGKTNEQLNNQYRKIRKAIADQRRLVRQIYKPKPPLGLYNKDRFLPPPKTIAKAPQTPHHMMFGEIVNQGSGNTPKEVASVVSVPFHDINVYLDNETIEKKAGCSLDGLFRPFSTNDQAVGLPHFTKPQDESTTQANSITLNPFSGGDIGVMVYGNKDEETNYNNDLLHDKPILSDNIRGIGLRAPLILVGYGYDVNGKPVPNKTPDAPGDEFDDNYKTEQTKHKAGPLDARWDESRGVWVAGGTNTVIYFKMTEDGQAGYISGLAELSVFDYDTKELKKYGNGSGYILDPAYIFPFWWQSGTRGVCYDYDGVNFPIIYAQCNEFPYI